MTDGALHIFKVSISASIERVFYELTRTDALQACAANSRLVTAGLVVGEPLQWRSASGRHAIVAGQVLAIDAPHSWSHTFNYCRHDDAPFEAHYQLLEREAFTDVTVTLNRVPMHTATAVDIVTDMRRRLHALQRVAEKHRASPVMRLRWWASRRTERWWPARCRVEHWPLGEPPGVGPRADPESQNALSDETGHPPQ